MKNKLLKPFALLFFAAFALILFPQQASAATTPAAPGTSISNAPIAEQKEFYTFTWPHNNIYNTTYYYKITVPGNGLITFSSQKPYGSYVMSAMPASLKITLLDSTGKNTVISHTVTSAEISTYSVGVVKGTYYFMVTPTYTPSGSGALATANSHLMWQFSSVEYNEQEPNNTKASATALTLNKIYTCYYGATDDGEEYYKCNLTAGKIYRITFADYAKFGWEKSGFTSSTGTSNVTFSSVGWYVMQPDGSERYRFEFTPVFTGKNEKGYDYFTFMPKTTGTYYLYIQSSSASTALFAYGIGVYETDMGLDITKANLTLDTSAKTYTGKAIAPPATLTATMVTKTPAGGGMIKTTYAEQALINGKDYTVSYTNNTNIGTATVRITGMGDYSGTITKTFAIKPINLSVCKASLAASTLSYNGKVQSPKVSVRYNGFLLKQNTDYTVSYGNGRKDVGKYTVTVTGKGNFSGKKTLSFTIKPKGTSIAKLSPGKMKMTVKWKKISQASGYEIQYSVNSNFKKAKTAVAKKNQSSLKLTGLIGWQKYYVRIRTVQTIKGKPYYSAWSAKKSKKTK